MKTLLFFLLSVGLAGAEEFTTLDGKKHSGEVRRIELDSLVLETDSGIVRLPLASLTPDVQSRFGYDPAKVAAAQASKAAAAAQSASKAAAPGAAKPVPPLSRITRDAAASKAPVRIWGRIEDIVPEGVLVSCRKAESPASGLGRVGGGFARASAPVDDRPEEIAGRFLLIGHPSQKTLADGDGVDVDAVAFGIFRYRDVSGGGNTLRAYRILKVAR